jgi:hypothetical protein
LISTAVTLEVPVVPAIVAFGVPVTTVALVRLASLAVVLFR